MSPRPYRRARPWWGDAILALCLTGGGALLGLLIGSTSDGPSNQDREDARYRTCLAAGGSWKTDDVDFECMLAGSHG